MARQTSFDLWLMPSCLSFMCKEDGSFHTEVKVPHFGFEPVEVEQILCSNGLKHVKY